MSTETEVAEALRKLERAGYVFWLTSGGASYRYMGADQASTDEVHPLLILVRLHRDTAIACLKAVRRQSCESEEAWWASVLEERGMTDPAQEKSGAGTGSRAEACGEEGERL